MYALREYRRRGTQATGMSKQRTPATIDGLSHAKPSKLACKSAKCGIVVA
jgi:hypothetical protein